MLRDSIKYFKHLPPPAARLAKRVLVYPRYWSQARKCRQACERYGERYAHKVLFVAGLPKSGSTWLEKMLSSYPGFNDILIPDVATYELASGGSHDYQLPDDIFQRFEGMLLLTKMHVNGSAHNAAVLKNARIPYVVLYRDLRDVAVSHYYYVRQTPWHPEYPLYAKTETVAAGLRIFAQRLAAPFAEWMYAWRDNRDPELSVEIRYEDMLADTARSLRTVLDCFHLPATEDELAAIVERNSFRNLKGGHSANSSSGNSFFRKGVSGDWVNHFDEAAKDAFKEKAGQCLIDFGYEAGLNW